MLPGPNVQATLVPRADSQPRMKSILPPSAGTVQIVPEDGVPDNRLERDASIGATAIHKLAPFWLRTGLQLGEAGAAAGAVGFQVDEEGGLPLVAIERNVPVVMV